MRETTRRGDISFVGCLVFLFGFFPLVFLLLFFLATEIEQVVVWVTEDAVQDVDELVCGNRIIKTKSHHLRVIVREM